MRTRKVVPAQKQSKGRGRPWREARDLAICMAVYDYRFLLRDQVQRLFFTSHTVRDKKTGGTLEEPTKRGDIIANRRLKTLEEHGYLSHTTIKTAEERTDRNTQRTYALTREGARLLAREGLIPESEVRHYPGRNDVTDGYTVHRQEVNDVRIAITKAACARGDDISVWVYDWELRKLRLKVKDRNGKRYHFEPDAFFAYQLAGEDWWSYFFYERDTGSQTNKIFAEKVKLYLLALQTPEVFEVLNKLYDVDIQGFRVLTTTLPERVANLKRTTEAAGGAKRFWFTSHRDIDEDTVLGPVWEMATSSEKVALFRS